MARQILVAKRLAYREEQIEVSIDLSGLKILSSHALYSLLHLVLPTVAHPATLRQSDCDVAQNGAYLATTGIAVSNVGSGNAHDDVQSNVIVNWMSVAFRR